MVQLQMQNLLCGAAVANIGTGAIATAKLADTAVTDVKFFSNSWYFGQTRKYR